MDDDSLARLLFPTHRLLDRCFCHIQLRILSALGRDLRSLYDQVPLLAGCIPVYTVWFRVLDSIRVCTFLFHSRVWTAVSALEEKHAKRKAASLDLSLSRPKNDGQPKN